MDIGRAEGRLNREIMQNDDESPATVRADRVIHSP